MRSLFALLVLAGFAATPLHAQSDARGGFGVGVRVTNVLVLDAGFFGGAPSTGGPTLLFPIAVSDGFRIEPEFGFSSSDSDEVESTQFTLGLGLLPTFQRGAFTLYTGGRFRYVSSSREFTVPFGPSAESSTTGFGIAPVVGGEHHFSRWFSLGAEAGLGYTSLSAEQDDTFGDEDEDLETSSFSTQGSVFLRFYFN